MENVTLSKICGLCAGCRNAVNTAIKNLNNYKKVTLFKEIVHNKSVNERLASQGIEIKNSLDEFENDELVVLRAHGEPKSTYDKLKELKLEYVDCTCVNVKKIHELVNEYSNKGYKIIIIGKYGKNTGKIHPEILGTMGWCTSEPILIEDEDDINKIKKLKDEKFYLVCQTTFNMKHAGFLANKILKICNKNNCELIINLTLCSAQKLINEESVKLAKKSDFVIVVGSKNSSNTIELFNNLSEKNKTIFLEDLELWKEKLKKNDVNLSSSSKIGITAGASTDPNELNFLKQSIENYILEKTMNIDVIKHASIRIDDIYFDPYNLGNTTAKAKYIFITHPHYDHLSNEDIDKIVSDNTIFVAAKDCSETLEKYYRENEKYYVLPNQKLEFEDLIVETIPSYNINKAFHKNEFDWVGYKIIKDNISYVIVGDSDVTPELEKIKCDVLFVPIGGTYTMTAVEAAKLVNIVKPNIAVPVHYNCIVGSKEDEKIFCKNVDKNIEVKLFL